MSTDGATVERIAYIVAGFGLPAVASVGDCIAVSELVRSALSRNGFDSEPLLVSGSAELMANATGVTVSVRQF